MGEVMAVVSLVLILSGIYLRVEGRIKAARILFSVGLIGLIFFAAVLLMAITEGEVSSTDDSDVSDWSSSRK
ncbi:hypothetical protein EPO05_00015 [Patescibacteria group bacterium]|nr:MAG: hypothetical protein EPO05_00015 [Patescibacteria group bacterium]